MDLEKQLNTLLVTLFQDILDIEEKALITEDFRDITLNDMHVIEAIGIEGPRTSSAVAKTLSVTMGTLTKAIDRLVKNGYVLRERSEEDKRLVLLSLKEKGVEAYEHHQKFHQDMVKAVVKQFTKEEAEDLAKTLRGLIGYFRGTEENDQESKV